MKDLTQGSELKTIFYFSLPILVGNLFQQLYNVADSVIVGNFWERKPCGGGIQLSDQFPADCAVHGDFSGRKRPDLPLLWSQRYAAGEKGG